jgi:hypothetical protein
MPSIEREHPATSSKKWMVGKHAKFALKHLAAVSRIEVET